MKTAAFIFLIMSFLLASHHGHAQNISDCAGAISMCESFYFEEQAPLTTGDVLEYTGACNSGIEWNSVWYTFTVQADGNLSFILTPNNLNDDYDWGLFDITNGGCAGITAQDGSSPEVSCNAWGTLAPPNGPTGISSAQGGETNSGGPGDTFGPPFNADLPVLAGHTFALVVMNWTASPDGYSIDFAESTASLFDANAPTMDQATIDCANQAVEIVFSELVVSETAQDLDFEIAGPQPVEIVAANAVGNNDLSQEFVLDFDAMITVPGTYQLIITDASGLISDPCGNAAPDTIDFVVTAPIQTAYSIEPACNGANGEFVLSAVSTTQSFTASLNNESIELGQAIELDAGDYEFSIINQKGCEMAFMIEIPNEVVSIQIWNADTITCLDPVVPFDAVASSNADNLTYQWSSVEGTIINPNQLIASASEPGVYVCTVTTVPNGCSASASYEVMSAEVYTLSDDLLIWPNVISPNQDNKNDWWAPRLITDGEADITDLFSVYDLQIRDRWGHLLFESTGSRIWRPNQVSAGVYFYTLRYAIDCGNEGEKKREGTIQIVR